MMHSTLGSHLSALMVTTLHVSRRYPIDSVCDFTPTHKVSVFFRLITLSSRVYNPMRIGNLASAAIRDEFIGVRPLCTLENAFCEPIYALYTNDKYTLHRQR